VYVLLVYPWDLTHTYGEPTGLITFYKVVFKAKFISSKLIIFSSLTLFWLLKSHTSFKYSVISNNI